MTQTTKITEERKDDIIRSLLDEYCTGITVSGLEVLRNIMSKEELAYYGYELPEINTDDEWM